MPALQRRNVIHPILHCHSRLARIATMDLLLAASAALHAGRHHPACNGMAWRLCKARSSICRAQQCHWCMALARQTFALSLPWSSCDLYLSGTAQKVVCNQGSDPYVDVLAIEWSRPATIAKAQLRVELNKYVLYG